MLRDLYDLGDIGIGGQLLWTISGTPPKISRGRSGPAALRASYAVAPEIELSGYADKKPHSGAYPETI
jgi:hypothetical protein